MGLHHNPGAVSGSLCRLARRLPGGARSLAARPAARDFVTDAVAHCKFIGYTSGAAVLFEAAGLPTDPPSADEGFISLSEHPAAEFIARCRQLRHWQREFAVAV